MRAENAPELLAALMKPGGVAKAAVVYASVESELGHAPASADLIEPLPTELLEAPQGESAEAETQALLAPKLERRTAAVRVGGLFSDIWSAKMRKPKDHDDEFSFTQPIANSERLRLPLPRGIYSAHTSCSVLIRHCIWR